MIKRYEKYKDSGIEWISEIPKHWDFSKYKFNISIMNGFPFKSELFDNEIGFPIIRIRDITSGKTETFYNGEYSEEFMIKKGDVIVGMDGDFNLRWWENGDALLNQRCCKIVNKENIINLRFLYYSLPFDLKIINDLTYYTTVKHLSNGDINNRYLSIPPLSEQIQISRFLDHQTALIDEIISRKERQIELLKEKRQSIINEVVTKGLNSNAKMKDSGIEWLGEIPEHWRLMPLKYLVSSDRGIQTGPFGTQLNTKDYTESGVKVVNQKTLIDEDYESGDEFISVEKMYELNGFEVIGGDIIMGTRGSFGTKNRTTFGKCSIVPENIVDSVLHPCLIRIRLNEDWLDKNFFKFYVNDSSHFLQFIASTSNSTTIEVIYGITLKNIVFPVPPLSEQKEIADFIRQKTDEYDIITFKISSQIEKLKEYRQSLISEAVTGKIDVRDWEPKAGLN